MCTLALQFNGLSVAIGCACHDLGVHEHHVGGLNEESNIFPSYWLAGNWH